jgi:type III restriction enzyme
MLKEGWDVQNVTTIVGLRSYSAKANILPEQTLGRGLRRMYRGSNIDERLSVIGTEPFMDFVEQIQNEGVTLEHVSMNKNSEPQAPPVVSIDEENKTKDLEKLDIEIPKLTPRIHREYKNLSELNLDNFEFKPIDTEEFSEEQQKEIVFKDAVSHQESHITEVFKDAVSHQESHITEVNHVANNANNVVGYFAGKINNDLRLVGGYDVLYGKVKTFIRDCLFGETVDLDDGNILRNLSRVEAKRTILEEFKRQINALTVVDSGEAEIVDSIKISDTKSFVVQQQEVLRPKNSVFNRIIGGSHFEMEFAGFLDKCDDIISFAKNYFVIDFKLEYQNSKGEIAHYHPDFLVKTKQNELWVVETKGLEDVDVEPKRKRLQQWVEDVNENQSKITVHELFVTQDDFNNYDFKNFGELTRALND